METVFIAAKLLVNALTEEQYWDFLNCLPLKQRDKFVEVWLDYRVNK